MSKEQSKKALVALTREAVSVAGRIARARGQELSGPGHSKVLRAVLELAKDDSDFADQLGDLKDQAELALAVMDAVNGSLPIKVNQSNGRRMAK